MRQPHDSATLPSHNFVREVLSLRPRHSPHTISGVCAILASTNAPTQVFIEVNEKGTEAAAATAVTMMRCAMPLRPPPELRFDRPFVFGVQHVSTGALLFAGVVEQPEAWSA